jgi:hypothetical protein
LDDLRARCATLERAVRSGDEFSALNALTPFLEAMEQALGWLDDGAGPARLAD